MKRTLILYNIRAGRGRAERRVEGVAAIFREAGHEVRLQRIEFGRDPFEEGATFELIVICGGDGTINYVVNAMRRHGITTPLGIIPMGTANDFAGALGMSSHPVKAAQQIVGGRLDHVDCGCVNGTHFINVFSFGLLTTTSQHTSDKAKHRFGKLAYLSAGMHDFRNFHYLPVEFDYDGKQVKTECIFALVFNGETAGRFKFARMASVRDGLFDCIVIRRNSFIKAFCGVMYYFMSGKENFAVEHFRASSLRISSPEMPDTDMDGQAGPTFPLTIECLKGAVAVIVPDNAKQPAASSVCEDLRD